jgi:hypothetical protein
VVPSQLFLSVALAAPLGACSAAVMTINMLDIKTSADYLSRSAGTFTNFSMLFAGM